MTSDLRCEEARDLAAEMALGILAGDERARLIAHIGSCSQCRTTVEELSEVADSLLLLAPEREPPAGFESGFLAQFNAPVRRMRLRRLTMAGAAVAVALVAAGGVLWATAADRDLASRYRSALEEADGEYFGVRPVRSAQGAKVGNLFAYEGDPSWVFVVFDDSVPLGQYRAELIGTSDETSSLGSFAIGTGRVTWGSELSVSLRQVDAIRFTARGGNSLEARIQTSD